MLVKGIIKLNKEKLENISALLEYRLAIEEFSDNYVEYEIGPKGWEKEDIKIKSKKQGREFIFIEGEWEAVNKQLEFDFEV